MKRRRVVLIPVLCAAVLVTACTTDDLSQRLVKPGVECLSGDPTACRGADLSGLDLSGRDLSGRDLSFANLSAANLSAANLSAVDFYAANLVDANLVEANLVDAELNVVDLRDADLSGADLTNANLSEANLERVVARAATFDGALLVRAGMARADVAGASFRNTVVTQLDLRETVLDDSDWDNAIVRGEYDQGADLAMYGAVVCDFTACVGEPARPVAGDQAVVDPVMFQFGLQNQLRNALAYQDDVVTLSRHMALTMLAASGVYDFDRTVDGWSDPVLYLPDGLRDAAALYAMSNTSIYLRFNNEDPTRNGVLTATLTARDTMLWRATRSVADTRAAIVTAATTTGNAAALRGKADGYAERSKVYDGDGEWEPTPAAYAPALQPGWGSLRVYAAEARSCRAGVPDIGVDDITEVVEIAKALTRKQKEAARFWDDERIRTTTPIGHWHDIASQLLFTAVERDGLTIPEAIDVLVSVHLAMADAVIMTWYEKYNYRTARPITLIRETDPYWNSYLGNPPFPAYPSGHSAISAAAAEVLARNLGEWEFTDNEYHGTVGASTLNSGPRTFPGVRAAAKEAGLSRLWGGIHFAADIEGGERIGQCSAGLHADGRQ